MPPIVIDEWLGQREVLFDYDYDYEYRLAPEYAYGVVSFRRVFLLPTHPKTTTIGSAR